jgi:hypothetical protein
MALFPLMSGRFLVYEETIAYMVLFELVALSGYIFALRSWSSWAVALLGIGAGVGLVVRPTGLVCLGVWAAIVVLESRRARPIAVFAAASGPFLGFWLYSNWVKTGSPAGFGYNNSTPSLPWNLPMQRFGSVCVDTREHAIEAAKRLFQAFFVPSADEPFPWLRRCHFDFETRPPAGEPYAVAPFFGVTLLAILCWMFFRAVARRDRRLSDLVPFAALVFLFVNFVRAGAGFVWRYEGDFWPYVFIAFVQYVHRLPRGANAYLGWAAALVCMGISAIGFKGYVDPALSTLELVEPKAEAGMWDDFTNSRYGGDPALPDHLRCGDNMGWPVGNGLGWSGGVCTVDTFTNVYLGVHRKSDDRYVFKFDATGPLPPFLTVYLNGRNYQAQRQGGSYRADVRIDSARLNSPIVMATIQWTTQLDPLQGVKLTSIELQ